jgi:tetratricopeptide (TPR) repeat protein
MLIYAGHPVQAYEDCEILIKRLPDKALGYRCRAKVNDSLNKKDKAIEDLTHALAIAPKFDHARFDRGYVYIGLNNNEAAIEDFSQTIKSNYRPAESYLYRGIAKENSNMLEAALNDYQKALDLADKNWAPEASSRLRNLKAKHPQDPAPKLQDYPQQRSTK